MEAYLSQFLAKVNSRNLESKSLFSWKPIYQIHFQYIIFLVNRQICNAFILNIVVMLPNFSQKYGFIWHFPSVLIEKSIHHADFQMSVSDLKFANVLSTQTRVYGFEKYGT